jgi:superfamily I DNA and/or RNA helicase
VGRKRIEYTGIGFMDNQNRLNVALTRARYQNVVFGNRENMMHSSDTTELMVKLVEETPEGLSLYRSE